MMLIEVDTFVPDNGFGIMEDSALRVALRDVAGLRHVINPASMPLATDNRAILVRDEKSGNGIEATNTQAPDVVDGGATWNNRRVMDTPPSNNNLRLNDYVHTGDFYCVVAAQRPAGAHYLFQTDNNGFEAFVDSGNVLRWRPTTSTANHTIGAETKTHVEWSQLTLTVAPADFALYMFTIGADMTTALYVDDLVIPIKTGTATQNGGGNGPMWLCNSTASNALIGKVGLMLFGSAPLHKPQYHGTRKFLNDTIKTYFGKAL